MPKTTMRLIREGDLVAEVTLKLSEDAGDWSPTISVDDANLLDKVRQALRSGDLQLAGGLTDRIYRLTPVGSTEQL